MVTLVIVFHCGMKELIVIILLSYILKIFLQIANPPAWVDDAKEISLDEYDTSTSCSSVSWTLPDLLFLFFIIIGMPFP